MGKCAQDKHFFSLNGPNNVQKISCAVAIKQAYVQHCKSRVIFGIRHSKLWKCSKSRFALNFTLSNSEPFLSYIQYRASCR